MTEGDSNDSAEAPPRLYRTRFLTNVGPEIPD